MISVVDISITMNSPTSVCEQPASPRKHEQLHDAMRLRPHACPECPRRFKRRFTLKEHMKTHTGEKTFICPVPSCRREFTTSGNLSRHKRIHPWLDVPLECLVVGCKCTFPTEAKLQRHMTMVHFGASAHVCRVAQCGNAFSTAGNLRRHMKQHHNIREEDEQQVQLETATPFAIDSSTSDYPSVEPIPISYVVGDGSIAWAPLSHPYAPDAELLEALGCLFE